MTVHTAKYSVKFFNKMVNKKGLSENDWSVAVSTGSLLFYKYFRIHLWNGWPIHTVSFDEFLFGFIVISLHEVFIMIFFYILPEIVNQELHLDIFGQNWRFLTPIIHQNKFKLKMWKFESRFDNYIMIFHKISNVLVVKTPC